MKNKTKVEIHRIVDSLVREVNTRDCATVSAMTSAIAGHPKFLDYATATPELELKIGRGADGEIREIFSPFDLGKIIKNRILWNFRNLKDKLGFRIFHTFKTNQRTGKVSYIPPRSMADF